MSKQHILNNVKTSLQSNRIQGESVHYTNPLRSQDSDKIQEFIALQKANKAHVIESHQDNLFNDIRTSLKECSAQKILYNLDLGIDMHKLLDGLQCSLIPYDKSVDSIRSELFNIDTAIIHAVCGVANLGIIGIASSPKAPRLSSLITKNCIVLLKKQNIVEHFYDGVQSLKTCGENGKLPTNMIFIAGPSRTADIELQTVFGVHGSITTYVILY